MLEENKSLPSQSPGWNGEALFGRPLTGVQKGVMQGAKEPLLRLDWLWGDSSELLKLQDVSLMGGSLNLRPLGRGTDALIRPGVCRGF